MPPRTLKRPAAKRPILPVGSPIAAPTPPGPIPPEELEQFLNEADQVLALTREPGWAVLARDIEADRERVSRVWPKINPKRPEFDELRIHALASDRLLAMIEDYRTNRQAFLRQIQALERPDLFTPGDVDSETGLEG